MKLQNVQCILMHTPENSANKRMKLSICLIFDRQKR